MFHYFRFDLISDCWQEAYDLRPSFEDLKIRIKKLKDGDEVWFHLFFVFDFGWIFAQKKKFIIKFEWREDIIRA